MVSVGDRFVGATFEKKKTKNKCYFVSLCCLYVCSLCIKLFLFKYNEIPLGIVVGLGVGITRDCSIVMIAQYFKKKREFVEVLTVAGSGLGICFMSIFLKRAIETLRWR